ncbi:tetratricopeptide repeat protein [Enterovibrio sp. 27052020O]|uniref:tetratricopeptide repeat protein n=1 Tax=Enterovibrio sp. 27052020O TaxID=3241166 RepID=UPI00388CEFE8
MNTSISKTINTILKTTTKSLFVMLAMAASFNVTAANADETLKTVQKQWAKCQYDTFNKENKISCLNSLIAMNQEELDSDPSRDDLKVWLAINKSTLAGAEGGLGALSLVKEAKGLLEEVISSDSQVLEGSAYTSLGSLYYQVPGWPIGFGDDDEAELMLQKALAINPNGIDPNFFYGDFLANNGDTAQAIAFLKKAQKAAPREGRELADQGRQREIERKLKELE